MKKTVCFYRTAGFIKKTKKTPRREIEKAEAYRRDFLEREGDLE